MRIRILWVGKTKNRLIKALAADYLNRVCRMVPCDVMEVRDPSKGRVLRREDMISAEEAELTSSLGAGGKLVALDEGGREFTSAELARWLEKEQNQGTKAIEFVIGGVEGLSPKILQKAHLTLSLGRMTWTHEMCRVLLLEQIYRSFGILRNLPYHK
jgi:23S rRNA (pseudouridine1915-N3)-methyltransferase